MFPLLDSENLESLDLRHESPAGNLDEFEVGLGAPSFEGYDLDGYSIRDGELPHGHYVQSSRPGSIDIPFDGPGSYMDIGRGRRPPSNLSHLSFYNRSRPASPEHSESYEPQIVPISPSGEHRWNELEIGGTPYIVQRDSFPSQTFNGHPPAFAPGVGRQFSHVDSGLADMDLLNGVGERESLRGDNKYRQDGTSHEGADEPSLENHDSHGS